jgi:hypothetical protein
MASIVRREVRRRSGWGKLWRVLFFAWNIVLGVHTLLVVGRLSKFLEGLRGLEGVAWTSIATHVLVRQLAVWAAGAVVLGLLAYATRGERYLVETTEEEAFPKPAPRSGLGYWWIAIVAAAVMAGFAAAVVILGIPRR